MNAVTLIGEILIPIICVVIIAWLGYFFSRKVKLVHTFEKISQFVDKFIYNLVITNKGNKTALNVGAR